MEFKVNSGIWGSMFGVPDVVADNFLKLASGGQIKVLLYILRASGRVCTDEEISMNTGVSVQEAADAVLFWQQANVLVPQTVSPVQTNAIMSAPAPVQPEPVHQAETSAAPAETAKQAVRAVRPSYKPTEIEKIMSDSVDISDLFIVTQQILGPINNTFQNMLISLYDEYGLKKEVIITLIGYCKKIDKTHPAYIEKIAIDWSNSEIDTLEKAQTEVERLTKFNDFTGMIMKRFEMNRRPTAKQAEFIEQWRSSGFDIDLIHYAYEKTIEQINKLSFDYINKILLSWKDSNFTTVKQVRDAESDYRNKKKNGKSAPDADIGKYEAFINNF